MVQMTGARSLNGGENGGDATARCQTVATNGDVCIVLLRLIEQGTWLSFATLQWP
jgi:hypothetical protein